MFDAIRSNKRIAQVILAILIVPFALFGIEHYFDDRGPSGTEVAKVGRTAIYQNEFERALSEEQDNLRKTLGAVATQAVLESDKLRQSVLEQLVVRRMLALYASEANLTVSTDQLRQRIAEIEGFQIDGRFSDELYRNYLRQQPAFESEFAQSMRVQQLLSPFFESFVADASAQRLLRARLEERSVREMRFPIAPLLAAIKIGDDAIRQYYDLNQASYERPERVKVDYVVFDADNMGNDIEISEDEVRRIYGGSDYTRPEERRISHILIDLATDADAAAVAAAKQRAEDIVAELHKKPARFAEIAREKSRDPGTSANGGDLGYLRRDAGMDEAFVQAAFGQKKDEISNPVRTGYGFHIVQVTDIRAGGDKRPYEEVRGEIAEGLRKQAAVRVFAENAEKFSDQVYTDTLDSAASTFKLEIRDGGWIERNAEAVGEFQNPELVAALFTNDVVGAERRNTRAITVGPNTLVAARVAAHETARRLPLDDVRGQIEARLRREEAMKQAREKSEAALAALDKGESLAGEWSVARTYQRDKPDLSPEAVRAVFAAPVTKLPVRVAAELPDEGYAIFQIDAVEHPEFKDDDPRLAMLKTQFDNLLSRSDMDAFLAALRERYSVETRLPPRRSETEGL
ncbi:MAG: SurA N-terminal domain-containing protein [Azoarcus sp.]|nr:SurA N-terminal domain-containing protein [Azoarcus sp.]